MLVKVLAEDQIAEIDVAEEQILYLPQGMVGFEEYKQYALLDLENPYYLLQSIDDPHIGFVLAPPSLSNWAYDPHVSNEDKSLLELEDDTPFDLLCVVTISRDGQPETLNLRAPLVINRHKMKGVQIILQDSAYPVRCPIVGTSIASISEGSENLGEGQREVSVEEMTARDIRSC